MRDIAQVFRTHWEHARMKSILFLFLLIVSFRLGGITNRNTNTIRKNLGRVVHSLSACVAGVSRACRSRLGFANFYCGRE